MINEKALFIGPHGENREYFFKQVNTLLEDVVQWRRNFHPNDPRLVVPKDQREESFLETQDTITQALEHLLGEMKQSVPFHSPRFLGHMHSDLVIPALLGYLTGMLYNQNNVVGESSPITTRKEIEFCRKMCEMVGYKPFDLIHKKGGSSWGHLCSGGTTANLEAVWIARNMKYYPLSIKLVFLNSDKFSPGQKQKMGEVEIRNTTLKDAAFNFLFNLSCLEILCLKDKVIEAISDNTPLRKLFEETIDEYEVRHLGVAGIHQKIEPIEHLPLPKLYVSTAGHYSWEKCLDIVGIGKSNVCRVEVDTHFQIHQGKLRKALEVNKDNAVLMVVGIVGTTEEGAIDNFERIRDTLMAQKKGAYYHADGAYGGYFCSMLRESTNIEVNNAFNSTYHTEIERIQGDLNAVASTDSIAIDPHKLGYAPYAAGAIFFSDTRYKDFLYKSAPYLAVSDVQNDPIEKTYLGGWTLEGSRAGATALACALSAEVISLDKAGYGKLMAETIRLTKTLKNVMENMPGPIKIIPIYEPHTNIVCFAVTAPEFIKEPRYLNLLTNSVIKQMSITPERVLPDYRFVTSKTDLSYDTYKEVINVVLNNAEIIDDVLDVPPGLVPADFKLEFLRTVIMHPTISNYEVAVWSNESKKYDNINLFEAFVAEISRVATLALPNILLEIIKNHHTPEDRIKILWVENKETFEEHQRLLQIDRISGLPAIGKYLDITFYDYHTLINSPLENNEVNGIEGLKIIIKDKRFDCSVIDLNLADNQHIEWGTGIAVLNTLYPAKTVDQYGKPILFSKFFDDENDAPKLKNYFISQFGDTLFSVPEAQFLAKTVINGSEKEEDAEHSAINELVKSIYQVIQKK